jgi:hypothetical protein
MKATLTLAESHPRDCPESDSKRPSIFPENALERIDLIHSEFERRKQLGLPYPSLHEIDHLLGRSSLPPLSTPTAKI